MQDFIKTIFAGIMIGIAGAVFLNISTPWIAAVLFSIGLLIICVRQYGLYTGRVGYVNNYKDILPLVKCIIGNFIGVFLVSLTLTVPNEIANTIANTKLQIPYLLLLLKSIGCGFLMYIAVDTYKSMDKNIVGILACVPAFILAGFEHSIADMFYFCAARTFNLEVLIFILIVIIGNAIGAFAHKLIK